MEKYYGESIMIIMIGILTLVLIYKVIRTIYIYRKYSVCPKCGHKTTTMEKTEYTYADQETYIEFKCTNFDQNCGWKYNFK